MKHAPESYFAEDAARVAASLTGKLDRETQAQTTLTRDSLRRANQQGFPTNFPTVDDRARAGMMKHLPHPLTPGYLICPSGAVAKW